MYCWRITKYDPQYRDDEGRYIKDDWTSFSDIGKFYEGKEFTLKEYMLMENKYIDAVISIMKYLQITTLEITNIEKYVDPDESNFEEMSNLLKTIKDRDLIDIESIPDVCRLILREQMWAKLKYKSAMFVHFGYDYYMYIGSSVDCRNHLNNAKQPSLFIEPFESPYI